MNKENKPDWLIQKEKADITKKYNTEIKRRYPDLGKIVKYKGEVGIVLLHEDFDINQQEWGLPEGYYDDLYVRWDSKRKNDTEQYGYFEFEFLDSYEFKYINMDGTLKNK